MRFFPGVKWILPIQHEGHGNRTEWSARNFPLIHVDWNLLFYHYKFKTNYFSKNVVKFYMANSMKYAGSYGSSIKTRHFTVEFAFNNPACQRLKFSKRF